MLLRLRLDRSALRQWHVDLVRRLEQRPGLTIEIDHCAAPRPLSRNAGRLFRFEALAGGRGGPDPAALAPNGLPGHEASLAAADRVIDLVGGSPSATGDWRLLYDGTAGEEALFASLVGGRNPVAQLVDGSRVVAAGRLGTEAPGHLGASFADALARTGTLIAAALGGAPAARPLPADDVVGAPLGFTGAALGLTVAKRLAGTAARRLHRLRHHDPNWRVGWRRLDGPDLFDLRRHPDGGWTSLPDDGRRFYADPFPIEHDGRLYLFVEEYPHATRKGIISAVPFGPDGPLGVPEPVLELPYHLSYPFVFARDGETWMVPESCAAGTVDLYRGTRFPGGWVKEATLVDGVAVSDATLFEHGGVWWLFATVQDGGSTSDALHLWSAPDFRGPWVPHRRNPVLIDSASARPAGGMVVRDGVIWRPVQDCRDAYGGALGLARVLALDSDNFDQRVEAILRPGGTAWPGHLLHTINRAGAFEFIDGSGQGARRPYG